MDEYVNSSRRSTKRGTQTSALQPPVATDLRDPTGTDTNDSNNV